MKPHTIFVKTFCQFQVAHGNQSFFSKVLYRNIQNAGLAKSFNADILMYDSEHIMELILEQYSKEDVELFMDPKSLESCMMNLIGKERIAPFDALEDAESTRHICEFGAQALGIGSLKEFYKQYRFITLFRQVKVEKEESIKEDPELKCEPLDSSWSKWQSRLRCSSQVPFLKTEDLKVEDVVIKAFDFPNRRQGICMPMPVPSVIKTEDNQNENRPRRFLPSPVPSICDM